MYHPKADLEHSEYEAISQFMKEGGRILLLLDRSSFNTTQGILQIYTTELPLFSQLLADYNIQINDDLIFSRSVEAIKSASHFFSGNTTDAFGNRTIDGRKPGCSCQ